MGLLFSKYFVSESRIIRNRLMVLLKEEGAYKLLSLAVANSKIYQVCKKDHDLREACAVAAFHRFYNEKFIREDVYNRTADFMVLLDDFVQFQLAIDEQKQQRKARCSFRRCYKFKKD
ncbi:hypothetical protein TcasGA2_TC010826 [Tribolium castaneum]|uniref:Uncharacterized protein n=1 Tax=Tribolium castaneum TaxID=7070 RepID=D6W7H0_TRICA|nr:PREDICTED: uncharacterized protein LOC107397931 [Tribolium castaneum]EFA11289.2 hypothetical protein TcasGA2_TC010826 [Tribolium castaneum]|eukprot:XP_015835492.1 PREDICTED: uncharacterized protein LOC107397931 [Tribolium castaneum]